MLNTVYEDNGFSQLPTVIVKILICNFLAQSLCVIYTALPFPKKMNSIS